MSEKFVGENSEHRESNEKKYIEYLALLTRAKEGVETLSCEDRERLVEFGDYHLDVEQNTYEAMRAFETVEDFGGLQKVADYLLRERPNSFDLPRVLTLLEDHEGIRDLLNREDIEFRKAVYEEAFDSLDKPLYEHIKRFLDENETPVATGGVNRGIDLIAIHNLALEYDVAVPIARGGLYQGAIANLWSMPTRILNIAAHNRKTPRGKWVNPVTKEDFSGKRVLLFDKDAVTGASVRKAVSMLDRFEPASIGAYFTHNVLPPENIGIGIGTITSGLPKGLEIFSPGNASIKKAGDAYVKVHEKLGTLYGRRRIMERLFHEEAEKLLGQFPELSESFKAFASKQFRVFDSLNPNLPGISKIREHILLVMNGLYRDHLDYLKNDMYSFPGALEKIRHILATTEPLFLGFESELVKARFGKQGEEAARNRNVENPHYPDDPLAAWNAAQKAVKAGFDVALIVGPEGFAYEPFFRDLGLPTVAVNIPESKENELRTIKLFDDLSILRGKKVLVVEDDIRTGATLQKLLEYLESQNPARLGLYLGQPKQFQKLSNIPQGLEDTYLAEGMSPTAAQEFKAYLESRGLKIFKTPEK